MKAKKENNLSDDDLINQIHNVEKAHLDTQKPTYMCDTHNTALLCDGENWFCPICSPRKLSD